MKKLLVLSLVGLIFILAGCTQQAPTINQNINKPTKTLTYLVSKEIESKYCNGADMDSDGYRKIITSEVTTTIPIDNMTQSELAKATIIAATTGQCQTVLKQNDLKVEGDTVYIAPIDGWAGILIVMCSCKPQIEVNLLRLPGIKKVIYRQAENQNQNLNTNQSVDSTLKKTKEDNRYAYYEGEITVSGKYHISAPGTIFGNTLCFYVDTKTGSLIPRENGDSRSPWFCFSNQVEAKNTFGINEKEVFNNTSIKCVEGNAKIKISNYIIDKGEAAVYDTAKLENIISKEAYSTACN